MVYKGIPTRLWMFSNKLMIFEQAYRIFAWSQAESQGEKVRGGRVRQSGIAFESRLMDLLRMRETARIYAGTSASRGEKIKGPVLASTMVQGSASRTRSKSDTGDRAIRSDIYEASLEKEGDEEDWWDQVVNTLQELV